MNNNISYKYQDLFDDIKNQINHQVLKKHTKLDSIRHIAKKRNISTTTVEKAYLQLVVEGYIYSIPKSGYYVSDIEQLNSNPTTIDVPVIKNTTYKNNALTFDMFDFKIYKSIMNKVINYYSDELLEECTPNGEIELREEIRKYVLKERDVKCDVNQIVIGPGTQNLLQVLLSLVDYETVSFLAPGFKKALNMFSLNDYQLFSHNSIKQVLTSHTDYLYISPSNIYPTGESLKINDRISLIKWAQQNNNYIIEDDYNFFIKYNSYTVPSIHSLDPSHVIYLGSFSKTLLPSMRISFMILPDKLYALYQQKYQTFSQGVSKLEQLTLALYFKEKLFTRHTRKLYNTYKKKNKLFLKHIEQYIDSGLISVRGEESNLHVLITFHQPHSINHFIERCKAMNYKYTIINQVNSLLFPYSGIENSKMEETISYLFQTKSNR